MRREDQLTGEALEEAVRDAHYRLFTGPSRPPKQPPPSDDEIQQASRLLFGGKGRRLHEVAGGGR